MLAYLHYNDFFSFEANLFGDPINEINTSVTTNCVTVNMDASLWFHLSFPADLEIPQENNLRAELQSPNHNAGAAKTHLTGCGDRWCIAVQTLFFFNLCLFHSVFRSGLQILRSDRTMWGQWCFFSICCFFFFFNQLVWLLPPWSLATISQLPVHSAYFHCLNSRTNVIQNLLHVPLACYNINGIFLGVFGYKTGSQVLPCFSRIPDAREIQ